MLSSSSFSQLCKLLKLVFYFLFRFWLVNRPYVTKAAMIIAIKPISLAVFCAKPSNRHTFVTRLFVSSAMAMSSIGRHMLYRLIF